MFYIDRINTVAVFVIILTASGWAMQNPNSEGRDKIPIFDSSEGRVEELDRVERTESDWRAVLSPEEYRVMRLNGTERPFTGTCDVGKTGGVYRCAACSTDLFVSRTKFESGTGWPSFRQPVSALNIKEEPDKSFGMERTKVSCARCGGHLGHVFEDGPPPTHKRFCINAASLKFIPSDREPKVTESATFAAGCFWGVEESFRTVKGVKYTRAGYTGGRLEHPTYEDVCSDKTGHAEAVEVTYDPSEVSYENLLGIFWKIHDPTEHNRQGPDMGSQYRSAVFYHDDDQKNAALASKRTLEDSGVFEKKIATEIVPARIFYPAEEYHQKYHMKHGNGSCKWSR